MVGRGTYVRTFVKARVIVSDVVAHRDGYFGTCTLT